MKKHILAAAVAAAVAAPAMAQNVTVYGNIDLGYSSLNLAEANAAEKAEVKGIAASRFSSSRIGVSANEDLGGGLKAFLTQEFALTAGVKGDTSTTVAGASGSEAITTDKVSPIGSNRTSVIGLSGSFGTVQFGFDKTASQLLVEKYDPSGAVNAVGNMFLTDGSNSFADLSFSADDAVVKGATGDRQTMVSYTTPSMNGFQARVDFGEVTNNGTTDSANWNNASTKYSGARLDYSVGSLEISVATAEVKSRAQTASAYAKSSSDVIGAKYKLGATELFGTFGGNKIIAAAGTQTSKVKNAMNVGFGHSFGAYRVFGQVGSAEVESTTAGTKAFDKESRGVGLTYALSKRTTVYALHGSMSRKAVAGTEDTAKETAIGINHKF